MTVIPPQLAGTIERRVLLSYRIDAERAAPLLPPGLRPQLVGGYAVGGVCLIRLGRLRLAGLPAFSGVRSENAAVRIAVEWNEGDTVRTGVFIPRRDTDSGLNRLLGGRLFPGVQHRADFDVAESGNDVSITVRSRDEHTRIAVSGQPADRLPDGSLFQSVDDVSAFFEQGCVALSPRRGDGLDALELRTNQWAVQPLRIRRVETSYFDDLRRFPPGTVAFDNALIMRDIDHRWHRNQPPAPVLEHAALS